MRFRFTLARDLKMTVAELENMDAREYSYWRILYRQEGEERARAQGVQPLDEFDAELARGRP